VPVVGVPLPFISYGGTSLLTLMFTVGLIMNIHVHRDVHMGVRGGFNDF
jgi:rod shape determining protein RodA